MRKVLFLIFLMIIEFYSYSQGYQIKIKINGIKNDKVILGHHFVDKLYPDDTVNVNSKGEGVFKGDEKLPGGMYFIYLPNSKFFDILINDNQEFEIIADSSANIDYIKSVNSIENELFFDYQKFMIAKQKEAKELNQKKEKSDSEKEKEEITEKIDKIREEIDVKIKQLSIDYPNTFFVKFLNATQDIEIPDPPKDKDGNVIDSFFQFNYYQAHYFDNFDISDPRLLRTPLYENKIMTYLDKVIPQIPDSLIAVVDTFIEKSRTSDELFRYMMVSLFNKYARSEIMGMDAVYIHIADKYYIHEATWSDTAFINDLKERIIKTKPLLIGKVAPNSQLVYVPSELFELAKEDTDVMNNPHVGSFFHIHDIKAEYIAIIFWSVDCGHCKKSLPILYKTYEKLKDEGFKVLAIHMLIDKQKWTNFINEHEYYNWINAWNPYSHQYKEDYDIQSTNVIYLLDRDKKIIAKRIGAEQVGEIVENELKKKMKNK